MNHILQYKFHIHVQQVIYLPVISVCCGRLGAAPIAGGIYTKSFAWDVGKSLKSSTPSKKQHDNDLTRAWRGVEAWLEINWCCFYYVIRNSLVALLEVLLLKNVVCFDTNKCICLSIMWLQAPQALYAAYLRMAPRTTKHVMDRWIWNVYRLKFVLQASWSCIASLQEHKMGSIIMRIDPSHKTQGTIVLYTSPSHAASTPGPDTLLWPKS